MHLPQGTQEITCRFSLAVMSDQYVERILHAIQTVDTTDIETRTDLLSTQYTGQAVTVLGALQRFVYAAVDGNTHMTMDVNIMKHNPKPRSYAYETDTDKDNPLQLQLPSDTRHNDAEGLNRIQEDNELVISKISFYPMEIEETQDQVGNICNLIKEGGYVIHSGMYFCDLVSPISELFHMLSRIVDYVLLQENPIVITCNMSFASPSLSKVRLVV